MSVPFDNATTLLTTLASAVRTFYHEQYPEMYGRFGKTTNRLFRLSKRRIDGNGIVVQVKDRNLYGARWDADINADFPTPRSHSANSYTVTLGENGTAQHFRRLSLSLQTTHLDLNRIMNKRASADDYINTLITQSRGDIEETMALSRMLDSTGKIAEVNLGSSTLARNDNVLFASATTVTGASFNGARFPIDNGSIAAVPPGRRMDIYQTSTNTKRITNGVIATDYNPRDNSLGSNGLSSADVEDSSLNIESIADNDRLYLMGCKDKNVLSVGHWFSAATSGESFFGKDRTASTNRWLLPHRSGPIAATQFDKTHLDDLCIQMGYVLEEDDDRAYLVVATPELGQRFRNQIGNDVILDYPTTEQKGKLIAQYGFDGSLYRHPRLGRMNIEEDPFAPQGVIRGYRLGDWESLSPGNEGGSMGFDWLPGDGAGENWYRMPSSTAGNGKTTTYRMDGMLMLCDILLRPRHQWEIVNLTV